MKFLTVATILAIIIPALGAPTPMPEADGIVNLAKRQDVADLLGLVNVFSEESTSKLIDFRSKVKSHS